MNKPTSAQDTRVRNAREEQTRDYATMPAAQIQYGHDQWQAVVEVDGDELARLRRGYAHTVATTAQIHVVDAGTKVLRLEEDLTARITLEAAYNPQTRVVTVWRDAARSVLGHIPLPERAPLTQREVEGIANDVAADALAMSMDTRTTAFQDGEGFRAYLDEVHAAIEHPVWCQRQDCWDKDPRSYVEHRRDATAHEWVSGDVDHHARASMTLFAETITPDPDEPAVVELSIGPDVRPDHLVFDSPAQLRALGQYLVTAADDLEWDLDDANKSTVNGVGIDWSWSITGNDKQAAGGDAR